MAQVLVQNRVSLALPVIPDLVQHEGINVKKMSPSTLMIVNLISPDGRYDDIFLSNYATIQIRDELGRLPGVADITYLGQRDYSMRAWLDPDKLAALEPDRRRRGQRHQRSRTCRWPPGRSASSRCRRASSSSSPSTRWAGSPTPSSSRDIIVKAGQGGPAGTSSPHRTAAAATRPPPANQPHGRHRSARRPASSGSRDVARVELGSQQYDQSCTLDGQPSVALSIYQLPGSNALETADGVYAKMEELKKRFPEGLDYKIVYDTTPFIRESVNEVFKTLRDAVILVAIVVLVFLQNWRAALIPLVAVPVAIVGTFAVMAALGFTLNNLSLFGLVLAIGIVVDDAIVVVENVERWLEQGLSPREAARKAMDEVTGPVIAVALVLCAVFVPVRVHRRHHRPVLPPVRRDDRRLDGHLGLQLADAQPGAGGDAAQAARADARSADLAAGPAVGLVLQLFNWRLRRRHRPSTRALVGGLLRVSVIVLLVYGGLLCLTYWEFTHVPTGFVPQQDKGYLLLNVQLPDSASVRAHRRASWREIETDGPQDATASSTRSASPASR